MRFIKTLTGALALVAMAACAGDYPMSTIDPQSDFADTIQGLYISIFWWTLIILVVVWAALAYILVRFRERPDSPHPKQIHGHTGLEIAWTIVPAIIVVGITIPTVQAVFDTQTADPDAYVVDVIGHQYWWEFRYPQHGDVVTANELRIPVDRPVSLRIFSEDVIHSFWIPALGGKRDANPLRAVPEGQNTKYNWIHLTPTEIGTYMGQCAEFCGESHSRMGMRVVVESEADFNQWLADWNTGHPTPTAPAPVAAGVAAPQQAPPAEDPNIATGRGLFVAACAACHAINASPAAGQVAPNLTLLGRRGIIAAGMLEMSRENLIQWISDPRSVKPGVLMPGLDYSGGTAALTWPSFSTFGIAPEQVGMIADYLLSLR